MSWWEGSLENSYQPLALSKPVTPFFSAARMSATKPTTTQCTLCSTWEGGKAGPDSMSPVFPMKRENGTRNGFPKTPSPKGCVFFFFFFFFLIFFRFSSGPAKCRILQHFLAKLTHFTLARQHPQHLFTTSPACPTNNPSITNKSWVTKSKHVAGGLTGSKQ